MNSLLPFKVTRFQAFWIRTWTSFRGHDETWHITREGRLDIFLGGCQKDVRDSHGWGRVWGLELGIHIK